jgi:hypothetical protein
MFGSETKANALLPNNRMQPTSQSSLRSRWLAADAERWAAKALRIMFGPFMHAMHRVQGASSR